MTKSVVLFGFWLAICPIAAAQQVSGTELYRWVQGIEGKEPDGRRAFVKGALKAIGVPYLVLPFSTEQKQRGQSRAISGENIVVSIGNGPKTIVVGAHLDAVPGSPGANDNGGGVAVVLGLIQAMKSDQWNYLVNFCFFDQEEEGLIGSAEFVRIYRDTLVHLAMINLDVEGTGEEIYVGPVGEGDDDRVMPFVRQAAATTGLPLKEHARYPPSDHLSFADRKLENISISVVPKGDVELLVETLQRGWEPDSTRMPKVLEVMHTPEDKSVFVSPEALKMSFDFTRTLLLLLNKSKL